MARKICKEVGLSTEHVLLGADIEALDDEHLADVVQKTTLFARVSPAHKQRIIRALQAQDHTLGFMGDGINDAVALRAADVGISVDTAVDVDEEQVEKPRPWDLGQLTRFIMFIGPCSSLFDYTTYFMMLYVFNCWDTSTPEAARRSASLFQTGWFVESLLTQTLIIYIIRTDKIPFLQSRPSWPLVVVSLLVLSILSYAMLTQGVKTWLLRRKWI